MSTCAQVRRVFIGLLLTVFFSLLIYDLLGAKQEPPVCAPSQAESLYHNEDSYPVTTRM